MKCTLQRLRGLLVADAQRSDRQLLECFVAQRDESAFEVIVRRHGPMVLGVCRRILASHEDAEDAFQAVFLVLARRAASLSRRDLLGNWLYGVAHRTSLAARRRMIRQRAREIQVKDMPQPPVQPTSCDDWLPLLDQELSRLPDKYRIPIVLCDLEGQTRQEAARQLTIPEGTLSSRLATARKMLARRLGRHGPAFSAAALAAALAPSMSAGVPSTMVSATVHAAANVAAGQALHAGVVSPQVAALAEGILKAMLLAKLKICGAVLALVLVVACVGAAVVAYPTSEEGGPAAAKGEPPPDRAAKQERLDDLGDPLPDQALLRVGTTRLQHRGAVDAVAASEDGLLLASCGRDKFVRVWHAKDGKPVWQFELPSWGPWALAFSRDSKTLAAVSRSPMDTKENGAFRRWNLATGKELPGGLEVADTSSHFTYHVALACRDDGEFLAAETAEPDISLYSPGVPKSGKTLKGDSGRIMSLCFTKDAKTLVSLSDEGAIRFWSTADGKEIAKLPTLKDQGLKGNFAFIAVSPDGKKLAVSLPDRSTRLLDVAGRELRRLPSSEQMHALAFSPDGKALLTGRSLIDAWDVDNAKRIAIVGQPRNPIRALTLSPDGTIAAFADSDNQVRLVEIASGKTLCQRELPCRGGLAFSPAGRLLAAAPGDNTVALWDVAALLAVKASLPAEPKAIVRCQGKVNAFTFSPDGRRLATVEEGKFARIYDVASKKVALTIEPTGRMVYAVAFSADGKLLATMSEQMPSRHGEETGHVPQAVGVWHAFTGKEATLDTELRQMAYTVAFHPNGKSLAALHLPNVAKHPFSGGIKDLDSPPIPVEDRMQTIRLWDAGFAREKLRFEDPVRRKNAEHATAWMIGTSHATPVAFSPDGWLFAAPGPGGLVLFETASGQPRLRLGGHLQEISGLAFTPDGKTLVSASSDSTLLIWDVTGLRTRAKLPGTSEAWWAMLADDNAQEAGQALWAMVDVPAESLAFLRKRLRPVVVSQDALDKLVADLDHPTFAVRDKAGRELAKMGRMAEAALTKKLGAKPSLETARRIEALLAGIKSTPPTPDQLRAIRAVEVLDRMRSREAADFLRELTDGAEGAYVTTHAREALDRAKGQAGK